MGDLYRAELVIPPHIVDPILVSMREKIDSEIPGGVAIRRDLEGSPPQSQWLSVGPVTTGGDTLSMRSSVMLFIQSGDTYHVSYAPKPWEESGPPPEQRDAETDEAVSRAVVGLIGVCKAHNVPEGHGLEHAQSVANHTRNALAAKKEKATRVMYYAALFAALLHDVDDRKYFPAGSENARTILQWALRDIPDGNTISTLALEAISYVSTQKNLNTVPPRAVQIPELLYPRYADRITAIGEVGVARCWEYTEEVKRPLYVEGTPRPASREEVLALATPERFAAYGERGTSASMIDHFYDKLLHLAGPMISHENAYISRRAREGVNPLVDVCMAVGRDGALKSRLITAKLRS